LGRSADPGTRDVLEHESEVIVARSENFPLRSWALYPHLALDEITSDLVVRGGLRPHTIATSAMPARS
jgi:hypothetical protein